MKILFIGGGTGGHVIPIIAITREIRRIYHLKEETKSSSRSFAKTKKKKDLQFIFLGPKDELGSIFLSQEGIKEKNILAGKIRRHLSLESFFRNLIDLLIKTPIGILQSFYHIFILSPDLIFSKGGFGSIPGAIAGKLLFVPTVLHESDIAPGMANKFLNRFALEIFTSFPKTEYFPLEKIILTGNPIRKELLNGSKEKAKELFNLTLTKPIILILGGSQGAQRINDKILENLSMLLENFEIIHQCGENNYKSVKPESEATIDQKLKPFYHLYSFLRENELSQAYAAADLIISRAGSGGIFEIAAVGKPSILIPLPEAAQNHQLKNAYYYQKIGACLVIEENNFTSNFFLEKLKSLFRNSEELKKMSEKAKGFSKPKAGLIIANYLVEYLTFNPKKK